MDPIRSGQYIGPIDGPSRWAIMNGDAGRQLARIASKSVRMCITSPPYLGKRNYFTDPILWGGDENCIHEFTQVRSPGYRASDTNPGPVQTDYNSTRINLLGKSCGKCGGWLGELGAENTPELYAQHLVTIFSELRRVLTDDGTLWLNLGDTRSSGNRSTHGPRSSKKNLAVKDAPRPPMGPGIKDKDLLLVPFVVAAALRADGWYLRSDIIWCKPSPKPESVKDRLTDAHEHLFMFSKSKSYYFDPVPLRRYSGANGLDWLMIKNEPSRVAHQAPFPAELARLPIQAGSERGDLVIDPFSGVGTTGEVALLLGRRYVGIELHQATAVASMKRLCSL